ncbi:MAG: response regulator [Deltaproteobacteria bacterium]|nr:response regulator [Deltaproteobacteria bacterium]
MRSEALRGWSREDPTNHEQCLEAGRVGTWSWRLNTPHLELSPNSYVLFGLNDPPNDPVEAAQLCWSRIDTVDRESLHRRAAAAIVGEELRVDVLVAFPNATTRCLRVVARVFGEPRDRILRGALFDVTADWNNVQRVCETNNRLQALAHTIPDMTFRLTVNGIFIDYKPAENDPGLMPPAHEVVGRSIKQLALPTRLQDQILEAVQQAVATGAIQELEYTLGLSSGVEHHFEARVMGYGRSEAVCIVRDVTDRRTAERELVASMEAADAGARAKGEFLATMSHEIRTPMNGVIGMAQLLAVTELDTEQKELVQVIVHSGEVLLGLINDVLDFSKIDAGKLQLESLALDLESLVKDCRAIVGVKAWEKGLSLDWSLGPGVPRWVKGDPTRLRQILINLLSNAVKFTQEGGVRLEVSLLRSKAGRAALQFAVIDSGIGIPAAHLGRLFERFSQADGSTTRRFGGTGLGLAICRQLVECMGGRISVTSTEGKGSCFSFEIDLELAAAPEVVSRSVAPPTRAASPAVRVLLADDNPVNCKVASKMLSRLGVQQIDIADEGETAARLALSNAYDLILMDVQMPMVDGLEATRRIRAAERGRRNLIVALTANASASDREICLAAGMDDFLTKPVAWSSLKVIIDRWIGNELTGSLDLRAPTTLSA